MPFDPTKPVEQTEIDAVELRNQFNALKALIDAQQAQITALQSQLAGKALMPLMQAFDSALNDPPTTDDLQKIVDWMNNVLGELQGNGS